MTACDFPVTPRAPFPGLRYPAPAPDGPLGIDALAAAIDPHQWYARGWRAVTSESEHAWLQHFGRTPDS